MKNNDPFTTVSGQNVKLGLRKDKNYCFGFVEYKNTRFENILGTFPSFQTINRDNKVRRIPCGDRIWKVKASKQRGKIRIRYESGELVVDVIYRICSDRLIVTMQVVEEKGMRIISIDDDKQMIALVNTQQKKNDKDMLVAPHGHGELFLFSDNLTDNFISNQRVFSWDGFSFNFVGMIRKKTGLIFRPNEFSTVFSYGEKNIEGKQVLCFGGAHYFRPRFCCDFTIPLCHKSLSFDLTFVKDENRDGIINWVDLGIKYRNTYIEKNRNPDRIIREGITGKIGMHVSQYDSYDGVIKDIETKCFFAPSTWWLVGVHVPKDYDYNWSHGPEPSWGDYFHFKEEAKKYGAKIGVHMNLDDVYKTDDDWDEQSVRRDSQQRLRKGAIWGGRQSYLRDIAYGEQSGRLYEFINREFKNWQVGHGDTWHWDVLTAVGGRECYSLSHPATRDTDFQARYRILKYTKGRKKIHITSEGTSEKLMEYCDFAWWSNPVHRSEFPNIKFVPLMPVILLGKCYYSSPYGDESYGLNLLSGSKVTHGLKLKKQKIMDIYFKQNLIWSQIADLEVTNLPEEGDNKWAVEYSDGSILKVNLETDEYSYLRDGILHKGYSPINVWGYVGIWIEGKFDILLPNGNYGVAKGGCKIEKIIKKGKYVRVMGRNKGLSLLKKKNEKEIMG